MIYVNFFLLPQVLLKPLYSFEEVSLQAELLKATLRDGSTTTGMNYPFANFVPRQHRFFFGALLDIDFDSNLSYQKKKES